MNIRKIKEVVKFDVERNIQNKWFVILNIFLFISIILATNWGHISKFLEDKGIDLLKTQDVTIQVLDEENLMYDSMVEKYKDYKNIKFEKVEKNEYSKENIPKDEVILVEIKRDEKNIVTSKVVSKEGITDEFYTIIYNEVKEARSRIFAENNNITLEELEILNNEPVIERELLGVDAENSDTKEMVKLISIVLVYTVLILILSNITNTIAQEKVSKSIEYVLTSVTAKEYLISKVIGVTLTVLTQVLYTFIYYLIGNMISSLFVSKSVGAFTGVFANVDTSIVSYVLVMAAYLIFTVFLTALIQATLSSKTTSVAEAGNTTVLLIVVVAILYFMSIAVISPYNKVSAFMYIISCLPLVSTFFVPAMMIIGQATTLQIIISFVVLIASVPFVFNVCSKHFKNGILDYTSTKKKGILGLRKNKQEMSLKEKQEYDLKLSKAKKFSFTIGMAIIIFMLVQVILSFVAGIAINSWLGTKLDMSTISNLTTAVVSALSIIITVGFIRVYSDYKKEEPNLDRRKFAEYSFVAIAIIGILQLILPYILEKLGLNYNILEDLQILPGSGVLDKIIFFISIAVIPAIFEELLFRKAILNYSKRYGNVFAVVFSSLLFALIHMNLSQGIFAFLIGLTFAIIAIKTNSIKVTVFLHFLNNGYAAIQALLSSNSVALGIFNNIVLAIFIFSVIVLIKNMVKLKDLKKEDFKINKDCMLIFKNYTFIVSMILLVVMFVVTENMLRI